MSVVWASGGTYAIVPSWLLDAEVSDRAVRLFAILATHANAEGRNATPSKKTLAARLRCSVSTIDTAVAALADAGAISINRRQRGDGSWTTNEYVLHGERSRGVPPDQPGDPSPDQPGDNELDPVELEKPFAPAAPARERNLVWDALVAVCGEPKTRSETSDFAKTVHELQAVIPREASGEEIERAMKARRTRWLTRYPGATFTHRVLRAHWSGLGQRVEGSTAPGETDLTDNGGTF